MRKAVYDSNNDGIVDNAEKVNGYIVEKDVPEDAVFTDTVTEVINNLESESETSALSAKQGKVLYEEMKKHIAREVFVSKDEPEFEECIWYQILDSKEVDDTEIIIKTKGYDESEKFHLSTQEDNEIIIETITNMTEDIEDKDNIIEIEI